MLPQSMLSVFDAGYKPDSSCKQASICGSSCTTDAFCGWTGEESLPAMDSTGGTVEEHSQRWCGEEIRVRFVDEDWCHSFGNDDPNDW